MPESARLSNFSFVRRKRLAGMGILRSGAALTDDLIDLARLGVRAVVCLLERPPDPDPYQAAGFELLHAPVADFAAPTLAQVEQVVAFVKEQNNADRAVAIHCHAGVGRTGTLLACCLVSEGFSADDALARIRKLRPGSVETLEQEQCVRAWAARQANA